VGVFLCETRPCRRQCLLTLVIVGLPSDVTPWCDQYIGAYSAEEFWGGCRRVAFYCCWGPTLLRGRMCRPIFVCCVIPCSNTPAGAPVQPCLVAELRGSVVAPRSADLAGQLIVTLPCRWCVFLCGFSLLIGGRSVRSSSLLLRGSLWNVFHARRPHRTVTLERSRPRQIGFLVGRPPFRSSKTIFRACLI